MNWNIKPQPKLGDKKEKTKFALFPVKVENKWIWLEKYISIYEYKSWLYTYEEVVSSGILYEKYITRVGETESWRRIGRKFYIKK